MDLSLNIKEELYEYIHFHIPGICSEHLYVWCWHLKSYWKSQHGRLNSPWIQMQSEPRKRLLNTHGLNCVTAHKERTSHLKVNVNSFYCKTLSMYQPADSPPILSLPISLGLFAFLHCAPLHLPLVCTLPHLLLLSDSQHWPKAWEGSGSLSTNPAVLLLALLLLFPLLSPRNTLSSSHRATVAKPRTRGERRRG